MAAYDIGAKGLQEVNLIIPQETSLTFDIVHKADDGRVIDHSESVAHMAFQSKDGHTTYDLDSCCECLSDKIKVAIPPSATESMPVGKMSWDIIVTMVDGEQLRIVYGTVSIVDTYALDDEG